jgi:D-alanine transfer protein
MLAAVIAGVVGSSAQYLARRVAARQALAAAATPAVVKSKTLTLQRAALADGHLLPVYGSSELYCCGDPYRATQLFASEPTGFEVFAIGRPGVGNLLFMEMFGALGPALAGRKVVIVDSPPWFSEHEDEYASAYAANFSPEIAGRFVFEAPISLRLREAAARRMLAQPRTLEDDTVLRLAVQALARPTRLRLAGYAALVPLGRLEAWIDESADAMWTLEFLARHDWRRTKIGFWRTGLDWDALAARATMIAERRDTTNPFGFPDQVFRRMMQRRNKQRLETALATYRARTSNRDGTIFPAPTAWQERVAGSPQWIDLRLAVAVLRELGAKPLVMTVPLPGFYDDHTMFSRPVRSGYYDRWERTAERTGVPWLDFRDDDEDPYFVTDTGAHLSPRGWIFADRALDMFWHDQSLDDIRGALGSLAEHVPPPTMVLAAQGGESAGTAAR